MKNKTALAVIHTDSLFFGKTMIDAMLTLKLKQICEDPDRFVKVTNPLEKERKLKLKEETKITPETKSGLETSTKKVRVQTDVKMTPEKPNGQHKAKEQLAEVH